MAQFDSPEQVEAIGLERTGDCLFRCRQPASLVAWLREQGYSDQTGERKEYDYVLSNKLGGSVGIHESGAVELIGMHQGVEKADALLRTISISFHMPIAQVFHIKNIDRVIVVGIIAEGSVRPGDELAVQTRSGTFPVTVEKLEHPKQQLAVARAGQDIGLMLNGISKNQVQAGDVVVSLSVMQ